MAGGRPGWPGDQQLNRTVALTGGKFQAERVTLTRPGRQAASPSETWRCPPQPEYLVFAGSQGRLVQLILAQAVGLGHLRGRLFEA